MYDAHLHLDFMENGEELARSASAEKLRLFSATVTPEGFVKARKRFSSFPQVDLGLGLHPWWVAAPKDLDAFLSLLPETSFVSEVGLDFGVRHAQTKDLQLEIFDRIAQVCARQGGITLSIHAVHASKEALDILSAAKIFESCQCIFHWFSGSSDQLKRAIDLGAFFSVGKRMLATGKGREYVKAIPIERLLTETDAPPQQGQSYALSELVSELQKTEGHIARIKGLASFPE